ncbi:MAG: SMP-30/gluconolactonase/LRE family protein [Pirellulales bacterium]
MNKLIRGDVWRLRQLAWFALVALGIASSTAADELPTIGEIERLDPAFDALVPPGAKMEIIADGFDWSEGPLWIPADGGFLIFSDIPPNKIYRWDSQHGKQEYLYPSGYTGSTPRGGEIGANSTILDQQGRLILCQHGDRRIARMDSPLDHPAPKFVTVADRFDGKRLNSPNDAALHSSGAIYFTDPPYGLEGNMDDPAKELDFQGVYRVTPDGAVTLLTKELERPNGIAFSPDEKTLYVANSHGPRPIIMAFPVLEDGTLGAGKVFFDCTELAKPQQGGHDGMELDEHGNLFATGPGGVLVLSPEGKHLGTLKTGQATSNVAFGEDGKTLFITADMYVLRIPLTTKGKGF